MIFRPASDRSLLVSFDDRISEPARLDVMRLVRALEGERAVVNLHPAFASVLVEFDPRRTTHEAVEALARARFEAAGDAPEVPGRSVRIPAVYGGEEGPDLAKVAQHAGLSAGRVVELHASAEYVVAFLGFATAFVYLAGLPPELDTPRLATPRTAVPAGSIAIAGAQAGIYPLASPGGWRVIARTPLRLFDPRDAPPPALRMGDRVRFVPVEAARL